MHLTTVAGEMKTHARQHPFDPTTDLNGSQEKLCQENLSINDREVNLTLVYTTLPATDKAFWHLTITPIDKLAMTDQLVNEIVVSFFDTSLSIVELPDSVMAEVRRDAPYQRQFSQAV